MTEAMRKILALATAIALGACAVDRAEPGRTEAPITNGTPTEGEPSVVGISGSGTILCTGVVIGPRLVLTAAHCLVGAGERAVWVGSSTATGASLGIERMFRHPDFVEGEPAHDVGIVFVDRRLGVPAVTLSSTPMTAGDRGRVVRTVGFGRTSGDDETEARKRTGESAVGTVADRSFHVDGWWDGANCYTGAVPSGSAGGFVYNSQLYYQPVKQTGYCPQAGSWWDGANCHLPNIPAGTTPFIYNGNPYYSYASGGVRCPIQGSWDDGANCFVSKPSLGLPFVYAGQLYYWMPSCPVAGSWFDGANCKMPDIPANRSPFIWSNGMYYKCQ